jgi:hypothetical protein
MRVMVILAAVTLSVAIASVARAAPTPPQLTVPCWEVAGQAASGTEGGYRVVLGVVSVPPAYLDGVVATRSKPWAYWRKAGLVVLAGNAPVDVSVPRAWRDRVAITWGNRPGYLSSLRIAACGSRFAGWLGYAGGFYIRAPSACVPLIFRVGRRSATVRFGIGQTC